MMPQVRGYARPTIERRFQVLLVDQAHQAQVELALTRRLVVIRRARQADQFALPPQAERVVTRLHQGSLGLNRNRQLFFEPVELHSQASDLLIQLGFPLLKLAPRAVAVAPEEGSTLIQQLTFPLADLVRVDTCFTGDLRHRLGALGGLQGDFELEL